MNNLAVYVRSRVEAIRLRREVRYLSAQVTTNRAEVVQLREMNAQLRRILLADPDEAKRGWITEHEARLRLQHRLMVAEEAPGWRARIEAAS